MEDYLTSLFESYLVMFQTMNQIQEYMSRKKVADLT